MIKQVSYVSCFVIVFCLLSCADNSNYTNQLPVVGTWTVDESRLNGELLTDQSTLRNLTADNRFEFWFPSEIPDGPEVRIELGNWVLSSNTLIIDYDNPGLTTVVYMVTELESSLMKWEAEIPDEGLLEESLSR